MIISVQQHSQTLYDINILDEDLYNGVEVLIGREEDCHIQLDSYLISRYHAKVLLKDGKTILEVTSDYGGVYRSGAAVQSVELIENDRITISEFDLIFSQIPVQAKPQDESPAQPIQSEPLEIDEAFSKTEMIERVNEETVQIPQELEAMMEESPPMEEDLSSTDAIDEGNTEFLAGADLPDGDFSSTDMMPESDLLGEDLSNADLADDLGGSLGNDLESDLDSDLDNDFDNPLDDDFDRDNTEASESESEDSFNNEENNFNENTEVGGFETDGDFNNDDSGFGDAGGFDDNSGFGGEEGGGTGATQVFQSFAKFKLKLFGEYAQIDSFMIEDAETNIGRDEEKCQIVLNDPEVSKVHATIKKSLVSCILMDNDSSNGIICNGERVKKVELVNGDEFIIGDTTFTVEVISDIIEAEKDVLMPVEEGQEVEIEEIIEEEVDFEDFGDGEAFGETQEEEKSFLKRIWKDKRKRTYFLFGLFILGLFLLLADDSPPPKPKKEIAQEDKKKKEEEEKPEYDEATLSKLEQNYALALARFDEGNLSSAKEFIDIVNAADKDYKNARTLTKAIEEGLKELELAEQRRLEEEARLKRLVEVKALVERARKAVDEKRVKLAEELFTQILKKDPENIDVPPMQIEIRNYVLEEQKKKEEIARAKARRQAMVDKLKPGKTAYIQEEWYQAAEKLEKFIKIEDMDEDLVKEASQMLKESRMKLAAMLGPLVSKARSFKEGQDLKQAYETYGEILKLDPTHEESLNERDAIFSTLLTRSKKVYREALIAESLSLFGKAKEKFQEVQQISPINSEYYNKATEKLKSYLE